MMHSHQYGSSNIVFLLFLIIGRQVPRYEVSIVSRNLHMLEKQDSFWRVPVVSC